MNISLEKVSAGYGKENQIIKDISLTFSEGGICGILGPNGSGKTTLLRVLSGTLPYAGAVTIETGDTKIQAGNSTGISYEIKNSSRKILARYIAMTPQFSTTYFAYNVYDTIMMGRYAHMGSSLKDMLGGVSSKDREVVDSYLEKMGLSDIKEKSISELSGGQLERVLLARTFAQETPVILLDEPTNHLDIRYQSELIDYLKDWSEGHTEVDGISYKNTIISVFHDIETAAYLSDEIMLMKDGNVIKKGPTKEALDKDLLEEVYETDVLGFLRKIKF